LLDGLYQTYIVEKKQPNEFKEESVSLVNEFLTLEEQVPELISELTLTGLESIAKGEVAIILLAGG